MAGSQARTKPNLLVTGTPGTGKTTTCSLLADATGLRHINVGDLAKAKGLHDGWDDEFDCHIINEDLVCDELEDMMEDGGNIVDYHGCDFFAEGWFDSVVVLQTDNSILHDRLSSSNVPVSCPLPSGAHEIWRTRRIFLPIRGYMGSKLTNNIECEIFQVLLEEARASYSEDIVMPLQSDCVDDISRNVARLTEWISNWRPPRSS